MKKNLIIKIGIVIIITVVAAAYLISYINRNSRRSKASGSNANIAVTFPFLDQGVLLNSLQPNTEYRFGVNLTSTIGRISAFNLKIKYRSDMFNFQEAVPSTITVSNLDQLQVDSLISSDKDINGLHREARVVKVIKNQASLLPAMVTIYFVFKTNSDSDALTNVNVPDALVFEGKDFSNVVGPDTNDSVLKYILPEDIAIAATIADASLGSSSSSIASSSSSSSSRPASSSSSRVTCEKTKGDANCDGKIDLTDYSIWLLEFKGKCGVGAVINADRCQDDGEVPGYKDGILMDADFNNLNGVTLADYSNWYANWPGK